jgi:magnesium-transporting ATPase (P-type)
VLGIIFLILAFVSYYYNSEFLKSYYAVPFAIIGITLLVVGIATIVRMDEERERLNIQASTPSPQPKPQETNKVSISLLLSLAIIVVILGAIGWILGLYFAQPYWYYTGHTTMYALGRLATIVGPIVMGIGIISMIVYMVIKKR